MGYNYVLGTREEENCFVPVKVHPKMFFESKILTVGCGSQHVVVLTSSTPDNTDYPKLDFSLPLPEKYLDLEYDLIEEEKDEVKSI